MQSKPSTDDDIAQEGGTLGVMFRRLDKDRKGYISKQNLQDLMKDDKTHFQGKDVDHILEKYGTEGKLSFEQFKMWWNSTYTTYNDDDALQRLVDEVQEEQNSTHMEAIPELPEIPHNSNVAISRS